MSFEPEGDTEIEKAYAANSRRLEAQATKELRNSLRWAITLLETYPPPNEFLMENLDQMNKARKLIGDGLERFIVEHSQTGKSYYSEISTSVGPIKHERFVSNERGAQATADALNRKCGENVWIAKRLPKTINEVAETSEQARTRREWYAKLNDRGLTANEDYQKGFLDGAEYEADHINDPNE